MLSYRHAFHAGNFADVFKHVLLIGLIRALQRKDKPFRVFDTHAGAGRYSLDSAAADRNREYQNGIGRLWNRASRIPELEAYCNQVRAFNPDGVLREYPGSPCLIRQLLRPGDRLTLTELHPSDYPTLRAECAGDRRVVVHHADGYAHLKAGLPPPERRGLVFIDPAFERRDEFEHLVQAVQLVHQRWPTGRLAIWYPILDRAPSLRFQQDLQALGIPAMLCAELGLQPFDRPVGLHGCGMILINPPWQFAEQLKSLLPELLAILQSGQYGQTRLEWLTPAR